MTCPNCHQEINLNVNFCRRCGKRAPVALCETMLSTTLLEEAKTLLFDGGTATDDNIQGGTLHSEVGSELEEAVLLAKLSTGRLEGVKVAGYTITRKLGEGGMGAVYRAEHPKSKPIAIKILHANLAQDQKVVTRFFNEARAVNQIGNPHIVDISSFGRFPNQQPYMTMEFLEGTDLAERMQKESPLLEAEAIDIVMQVLDALQSTHQAGIIHRDLKPENIFLQKRKDDPGRWFVKVLDFGIAKLMERPQPQARTAPGMILGTPSYMSPEQARGESTIGFAADLYSLGVILYELLAGQLPFVEASYLGYLVAHQRRTPLPVREYNESISEGTEALVMRCLAKDPGERFASAVQMKEALALCLKRLKGAPMRLQTPARSKVVVPAIAPVVAPVIVAPVVAPTPSVGAPAMTQEQGSGARWFVVAGFSVAFIGALAYVVGG